MWRALETQGASVCFQNRANSSLSCHVCMAKPVPHVLCSTLVLLISSVHVYIGLPWWFSDKESTCNQEMGVRSMAQEDPLEKEMATHSRILAWEIARTEERGELQSTESGRVSYDLVTKQEQCVYKVLLQHNMLENSTVA